MAAADVDPGIRTADIVTMEIQNEQMRAAALDMVRREPSVAAVAASWPGGLGGRPAFAEGASGATGKSAVTYQFVSPEYFGVLDIDLVRGRGFAQTERSAAAVGDRVGNRRASAVAGRRRGRTGAAARGGGGGGEPDTNSANNEQLPEATTRCCCRARSSSLASRVMWRAFGSAA